MRLAKRTTWRGDYSWQARGRVSVGALSACPATVSGSCEGTVPWQVSIVKADALWKDRENAVVGAGCEAAGDNANNE